MTLLFIGLLLLFLAHGIDIVNHLQGHGLGIKEQPTHKTVVLMFNTDGTPWDAVTQRQFLSGLEVAVELDHCLLSMSGVGDDRVALKLFCPETMDNQVETDDLPPLSHTNTYIREWHLHQTDVSVNRQVKHSFWYGSETGESFERMMREYLDRKENPLNYRAEFVETPAPWGLDRIDMHFGLLDNEYQYLNSGDKVDVYIVDTGIRTTHHEFEGRAHFLVNTVGDGINDDCVGHGTHVAGIVGSRTYGVAKGVQLYAVKVLGCPDGVGDSFSIATGVLAILEHRKNQPADRAAVASLSLGGDPSTTINQAVLSLISNGIATIVAAGNEGDDACNYSPSVVARTSSVMAIGASSPSDSRPGWSNYGPCVSLSAPGQSIISTYSTSDTSTATLSGTSMATPFASGVAALILNQNTSLSPATIKSLLQAWATPSAISSATDGGKNLLYSLVEYGTAPDFTAPVPGPVPVPLNDSGSMSLQVSVSLFMILFIALL